MHHKSVSAIDVMYLRSGVIEDSLGQSGRPDDPVFDPAMIIKARTLIHTFHNRLLNQPIQQLAHIQPLFVVHFR